MKALIFCATVFLLFQFGAVAQNAPANDVAVAATVQALVNATSQQAMIDQLSALSPASFPAVLAGLAAANVTGNQLDMAMHAMHTILARMPQQEAAPILLACFNALESPAYFAAFLQLGMYQPKPGYTRMLMNAAQQSLQAKPADAQTPFISNIQTLCPAVSITGSGDSVSITTATGPGKSKSGQTSPGRLSESATDKISIQVK